MTNLHKKRGAALITAAVLALIALFGMTGCPNAAGEGGGKPTPTPMPNQAVLTLSSDMLNIKVKAKTSDGSAIQVDGCTETRLKSDEETELHAKGTRVILKGKITELYCSKNKLPALNVQGLNALKELVCDGNQIKAQAMTELLKALPARDAGDGAKATLFYFGWTGEGNCENFTAPPELKAAFEGAKSKNWRLLKRNAIGFDSDI